MSTDARPAGPTPVSPTGQQYEITSGPVTATVTELGAGLRTLTVDGRHVVRGYDEHETVHAGHGQQLIPWPNRIRDGHYVFDGVEQQLPLSEPDRHNAIHGLTRWVPWELVSQTADAVTQRTTVFPQQGWPGALTAEITHRVDDSGLTVEVTVTNVGATTVPYGYAAHPYLTVGEDTVDDVTLVVPAASYLEVDDRLLPVAVRPVDGTPYDLRDGRPLGDRDFDTAFTDLATDADGRWEVTLTRGDRRAALWGDDAATWIQVFTGNGDRTVSIAVEPMTCGPNAFNPGPTEAGMITIAPGEIHSLQWGISGS